MTFANTYKNRGGRHTSFYISPIHIRQLINSPGTLCASQIDNYFFLHVHGLYSTISYLPYVWCKHYYVRSWDDTRPYLQFVTPLLVNLKNVVSIVIRNMIWNISWGATWRYKRVYGCDANIWMCKIGLNRGLSRLYLHFSYRFLVRMYKGWKIENRFAQFIKVRSLYVRPEFDLSLDKILRWAKLGPEEDYLPKPSWVPDRRMRIAISIPNTPKKISSQEA